MAVRPASRPTASGPSASRRPGLPALLAFPLLLALAGGAVEAVEAQAPGTHQCGDILLVFRNPDLQPDPATGFIQASGKFFIQFQAIGARADDIKVFAFSFGPHTTSFDESACSQPVWVTGTYVQNYRADREPGDGFFIGINTTLVPDGTYAAAIHAYDGSNNELARFWALAVVDNCDPQPTSAQERCPADHAQLVKHDTVAPWPVILPGDGKPVLEGAPLTVEFGEPIANLSVLLNGADITHQLAPWEGRTWDDDAIPDYGPGGAGGLVLPPCSQEPPQSCVHWGPAFRWDGRALTPDDVLHVTATDLAGNVATKDVHVGSAVAGGAISGDLPNLQVTVDAYTKSLAPGGAATFRFAMVNSGGGAAHAFANATAPAGWRANFLPHEPVPPGQTKTQELTVEAPANAAPGTYPVFASIYYDRAGGKQSSDYRLNVTVGGPAGPTGTVAGQEAAAKGSPGLSAGLALVAVGAACAVALRRRPMP